jgi:hypothetical protein
MLKSPIQPFSRNAKVAQLVEHNLAKVRVAGPNPVFRSQEPSTAEGFFSHSLTQKTHTPHPNFNHTQTHTVLARVVELVDTQDLKSCAC